MLQLVHEFSNAYCLLNLLFVVNIESHVLNTSLCSGLLQVDA